MPRLIRWEIWPTVTETETAPAPAPAVPDTPTPPPANAATMLTVGQTVHVTSNGSPSADVTVTKLDFSTGPVGASSEGPKNGYFVVAHVTVKVNRAYTDGFDISSIDFYAKSKGVHYDEGNGNAFEAPRTDDNLSVTNLSAGEIGKGILAFDLPARHGQIAYAPSFNGGAIGTWTF